MIAKFLSAASLAILASGVAYAENGTDPADAADHAQLMPDAAQVTTKDDARAYGEQEFILADANADGKVTQQEFMDYAKAQMMAEAAEKQAITVAAAEPSQMSEAAAGGKSAGAELAVTAEAAKPDASMTTGEEKTPTPEQLFAELSGGKDTINEKTLVKARLENFTKADANGDQKLDDSEKAQFAALVWGRKAS